MTIEILLLWLIIWCIFLAMSIVETRGPVFEFVAGLWILLIGIYLYMSGLQYQSGITSTVVGDTTTLVYVYQEVIPPVVTYKVLWSIPFFALGIYIMFLAMTKEHPKK